MKWIRIVFIIISIILLFVIIYAIINCEVSYKYEIEGRNGDKVDILWVGEWLKEYIRICKYFLCYIIVTIVYIITSTLKKKIKIFHWYRSLSTFGKSKILFFKTIIMNEKIYYNEDFPEGVEPLYNGNIADDYYSAHDSAHFRLA